MQTVAAADAGAVAIGVVGASGRHGFGAHEIQANFDGIDERPVRRGIDELLGGVAGAHAVAHLEGVDVADDGLPRTRGWSRGTHQVAIVEIEIAVRPSAGDFLAQTISHQGFVGSTALKLLRNAEEVGARRGRPVGNWRAVGPGGRLEAVAVVTQYVVGLYRPGLAHLPANDAEGVGAFLSDLGQLGNLLTDAAGALEHHQGRADDEQADGEGDQQLDQRHARLA